MDLRSLYGAAGKRRTESMSDDEYKELLAATIESTVDGIYIAGLGGEHILSNTRFHEMVRIPKSKISTQRDRSTFEDISDQLEDPVPFLYWIHDLLKSPKADLYIMRFPDGRIYECYSVPLIKKGMNSGRVWTLGDITRLKKTEETAKLYLDLMSHDIRNRLQGIVMSVEILNLLVEDPNSTPTIVDIEDNVKRCATLISKVLAAERIDDAPVVPRSLTEAIASSVQTINQRFHNFVLDYDFDDKLVIMNADSFLETLFINLLENAILHNPNDDKRVWVRLRTDSEGFEVSVSDNGPGIDDERKRNLFDRSRRYGGVGLHVATQIAGKYGGTLKVMDRVPGDSTQGADFRVYIPEPVVRWG
jgi:signal transduction histidine kinase